MRSVLKSVFAVAAAVAFTGAASAATTTIDLFNPDSNHQVWDVDGVGAAGFDPITGAGTGSWGGSPGTATGIIGGQRDIYVGLHQGGSEYDPINNPVSDASRDVLRARVVNGRFSIAQASGAQGTVAVRWDGPNTDPALGAMAPTASFDIAANFNLDIIFSDQGFTFDLYLFTSDTQYSKVTLTSNAHNSPVTTGIPLAAFADCANAFPPFTTTCVGGGVDLANVSALMAVIDPFGTSLAIDLTLDQVTVTVPEPSSIALTGLALLGAFGIARRRNKKA